jgi:hypothetical protein
MCYDLNMKCPPQVHVLKMWFPASGTILGGVRNSGGGAYLEDIGGGFSLGAMFCPFLSVCLSVSLFLSLSLSPL